MKLFIIILSFIACAVKPDKTLVSEKDLREWVTFLSSDEMKGRKDGSPEMKIVSDFVSSKFREYGLKPLGNDFMQEYSYWLGYNEVKERNVIGWIEGSDSLLKNEYLVLSAHFDHVGTGPESWTDSVYNGANDNAAGTATLIGVAKYIRDSGRLPCRSIIFAAFSGEENGLRGSRYFVANMPVPHEKVFANVNFEMTGRSEELGRGKYYMTGCLLSNLDDIIKSYADGSGIELIDTLKRSHNLFNYSDNLSFSAISVKDGIVTGIPSGTFATSVVAAHIHTVEDEVSFFDFENMTMLVNHFGDVALRLSNEQRKVVWTDQKFKRP